MDRREFIKNLGLVMGYLVVKQSFAHELDGSIAVVLDDSGLNMSAEKNLEKLAKLHVPVTVATIPGSPYVKQAAKIMLNYSEADWLLHQPMEPEGNINCESAKGTGIFKETDPKDINDIICDNVYSLIANLTGGSYDVVPKFLYEHPDLLDGINNHMGSRVTKDQNLCAAIAEVCANNDLLLLDSKTPLNSADSKLYSAGISEGVRSYFRNKFLDLGTKHIGDVYETLINYAKKNNQVVIGHMTNDITVNDVIRFHKDFPGVLKKITDI